MDHWNDGSSLDYQKGEKKWDFPPLEYEERKKVKVWDFLIKVFSVQVTTSPEMILKIFKV